MSESPDDLKNLFVATVSHQLRTPLSVVKWVLSILETDPDLKEKDNILQLVKQAGAGIDRMVDTVNDLINVVRIEEGKLPITFQKALISDILDKVVNRTAPIAESMNLSFVIEKEEIEAFYFDPILMTELIENVVTNALDYSESGKKITLLAKNKGENEVEIQIINEGPGMSESEEDHVFEPFYRGSQALLAHPDGSGLGLYICKSIADAHGGSIAFHSIAGKTTTVSVVIPKRMEA